MKPRTKSSAHPLDLSKGWKAQGVFYMWILGNPIKIEGAEFSNERAIYICNHASPIDIFLVMWLTPTGTVGIAKKEVSLDARKYKAFTYEKISYW